MNLQNWCKNKENIRIELSKEYFDMYVGLKYSKVNITKLELKNSESAKVFLKNFKEPKILYYDSIASQLSNKLSKLQLKLHETRKKKICLKDLKFNGETLNWSNWRQFVVKADDKSRKRVFDDFITKTKYISPIIQESFDTYRKVYKKYDVNVLEPYLYNHNISITKLKNVVDELGSGLKTKFVKDFNYYSNEINGRDAEYYDDFYYTRNAVFNGLKIKNRFNILDSVKHRMNVLGFDMKNIHVDNVNRKGKYTSAFCSDVRIPDDVRVSYKEENFINDFNCVYHEFGHAVHFSNINPKLPYWEKYYYSEGLAETFSTFFENLVADYSYLTKELKFSDEEAKDICKRSEFLDLFAITFYAANSIFKLDYWEKNMDMEEANEYYGKMLKKYMGLNVDGRYWQLHHILPESVMYVPSYLLAMIRAAELKEQFLKKYGKDWYGNIKTGEDLRKLMVPGTKSPIASFENCDPTMLIKELK